MFSASVKLPSNYFAGLAARINRANEAGLRNFALGVQGFAVQEVEAIERRRVPTRREAARYARGQSVPRTRRKPRESQASDTPAWQRSGALLTAVQKPPIYTKGQALLTADVPYAQPREELGVLRMPKKPALGIVRRDPFFGNAQEKAPAATPLFVSGWNADMESGR